MNPKAFHDHSLYLQILARLGPEGRSKKAFELSSFSKELFFAGLQSQFPKKSPAEIRTLYLERLTQCYNRNF